MTDDVVAWKTVTTGESQLDGETGMQTDKQPGRQQDERLDRCELTR